MTHFSFSCKHFLAWFGLLFAFSTLSACAAEATEQPYEARAFAAAQAAGKPILVEVAASWCPTCKRQGEILTELSTRKPLSDMTVFKIDYDTQQDAMKQFNVATQAVLIVFKGKTEVGRSAFDTDPDSIEALIKKAG